jgi:hypothetical protein
MPEEPLTREPILQALRRALEPLPHVHAMWEGGSEAFGRTDRWSDVDLQFEVDDDTIPETLSLIEGILAGLSPIQDRLEMPARPGYAQVFYRFRRASPHLLLDLCLMKKSHPDKFLEPEIHGRVVIHFNKGGSLQVRPLDIPAHLEKIRSKLDWIEKRFTIFAPMVEKELHRGHLPAAIDLYYRLVLDALVDALRVLHAPEHFDFKVPYSCYDLPPEVYQRLSGLFLVADEAALRRHYEEASAWFRQTLAAIDLARAEEMLRTRPGPGAS